MVRRLENIKNRIDVKIFSKNYSDKIKEFNKVNFKHINDNFENFDVYNY